MRYLLISSLVTALMLLQQSGHAQEAKSTSGNPGMSDKTPGLKNTSWKSFIGGSVNDTMVLKYAADSSYFQTKKGETMVSSTFVVTGDTLSITDVGGRFACLNQTGKYHFTVTGDSIKFDLIEDNCQGRAGAMAGTKWQRMKDGSLP